MRPRPPQGPRLLANWLRVAADCLYLTLYFVTKFLVDVTDAVSISSVFAFQFLIAVTLVSCATVISPIAAGSETLSIPNATSTTRPNASGIAARRVATMKGSDIIVETKCCGTRGREETLKLFLFSGGISGSPSWKRKVGRPASYVEIQKRSFDMYSINKESSPEVTKFFRGRESELCPVIIERDGKVEYYLLLSPSTDEEFFGLEVEETGHVALPLKSAASTENKLVQKMHAIRATLVKKCPRAPPNGDGRADSARMSFHRHYLRDNTNGDEDNWVTSVTTAAVLTPIEPATYSLAWAIALTQARMAVFPATPSARRYSTTTPLPAPQTTRQKHHFFKMFAAVNLSGMFVATLLNMVYGDESGINSEL